MKLIRKAFRAGIVAALAFSAANAFAQSAQPVAGDKAQLKSDAAALHREEGQLKADKAKLKADKAEGKMAAESRDSEKLYKDRQGIRGEKKDLATDKPGSLQKKADEATLQREARQKGMDEAKLKANKAAGRMVAESKDSEKVYKDQQFVKGEKRDIAADKAELKRDQKQ